jgi:hypothetical protein
MLFCEYFDEFMWKSSNLFCTGMLNIQNQMVCSLLNKKDSCTIDQKEHNLQNFHFNKDWEGQKLPKTGPTNMSHWWELIFGRVGHEVLKIIMNSVMENSFAQKLSCILRASFLLMQHHNHISPKRTMSFLHNYINKTVSWINLSSQCELLKSFLITDHLQHIATTCDICDFPFKNMGTRRQISGF